jgi:hypothetical protein
MTASVAHQPQQSNPIPSTIPSGSLQICRMNELWPGPLYWMSSTPVRQLEVGNCHLLQSAFPIGQVVLRNHDYFSVVIVYIDWFSAHSHPACEAIRQIMSSSNPWQPLLSISLMLPERHIHKRIPTQMLFPNQTWRVQKYSTDGGLHTGKILLR